MTHTTYFQLLFRYNDTGREVSVVTFDVQFVAKTGDRSMTQFDAFLNKSTSFLGIPSPVSSASTLTSTDVGLKKKHLDFDLSNDSIGRDDLNSSAKKHSTTTTTTTTTTPMSSSSSSSYSSMVTPTQPIMHTTPTTASSSSSSSSSFSAAVTPPPPKREPVVIKSIKTPPSFSSAKAQPSVQEKKAAVEEEKRASDVASSLLHADFSVLTSTHNFNKFVLYACFAFDGFQDIYELISWKSPLRTGAA
eukprot:TRINITY_DN3369_c0_g1_i3.p1 TRINITY_DN3369_c0_g1~~TRINITY_DN3369_c0_g1_i3.p1  ORF type:complete len:247 (-),score=81.11 TRINITY_DN3369_c0_g1_i3:163-903(-)